VAALSSVVTSRRGSPSFSARPTTATRSSRVKDLISVTDKDTYWRVEGNWNRDGEIEGTGAFFVSIEKYDGRVTDLGILFHPAVVPLLKEHLRRMKKGDTWQRCRHHAVAVVASRSDDYANADEASQLSSPGRHSLIASRRYEDFGARGGIEWCGHRFDFTKSCGAPMAARTNRYTNTIPIWGRPKPKKYQHLRLTSPVKHGARSAALKQSDRC
jgi:hypothetical protein